MLLAQHVRFSAAKNVILAGVRAVTIHDQKSVEVSDLSAQFYLTEDDVGQNRAEACKDKLQELNTAVEVAASTVELTADFLSQFQVTWICGCSCSCQHAPPLLGSDTWEVSQVVVLTSANLEESKRINEICHSHSPAIAFIRVETRGVFASTFCDFGPSFTVYDVNGRPSLPMLEGGSSVQQLQQYSTSCSSRALSKKTQL